MANDKCIRHSPLVIPHSSFDILKNEESMLSQRLVQQGRFPWVRQKARGHLAGRTASTWRLLPGLLLLCPFVHGQSPSRIVYPQAVVGQFQGQTFEIELRLGNGNSSQEWTGTVRLLRQQDLQGMTNVRYAEVGRTEAVEPNGRHAVSIPAGQRRHRSTGT